MVARWLRPIGSLFALGSLLSGCSSESLDSGPGEAARGGSGGQGECESLPGASEPLVQLLPAEFELPSPRGPYPVGTHLDWFEDDERLEPSSADPEDRRVIGVQFFYPSEDSDREFGPLMDDRISAVLTEVRNYPAGFHRAVRTHSRFDVAMSGAEERWPIVVYSHGQTTFPQENQALFEDLASSGWLVVAISHTYSAAATLLPDGSLAASVNVPRAPPDPSSNAERSAFNEALAEFHAQTWVPDVDLVLDRLEALDAEECHWLRGRLRLDQVGLIGYSFGGSTVLDLCATDPRCKAAINFDGGLWGALDVETDKPLMAIGSDEYDPQGWDRLREHHSGRTYGVRLFQANHGNFSQNAMLVEALEGLPARVLGFGAIDATRAYEIMGDYTFAMLNEHVLGEPAELLAQEAPYDEALFEANVSGQVEGDTTVLGFTRRFAEDGKLADVTIVRTDEGSQIVTDSSGRFRFDQVTPEQLMTLRFEHEGRMPTLLSIVPEKRFENLQSIPLLSAEQAQQLAASAAVTLDPERGHIMFGAYETEHGRWIGSADGLVAEALGEARFYYGESELAVNGELEGTLQNQGTGMAFNVAPGAHTFSVELAGATCLQDNRVVGDENRAVVMIEAGSITFVQLRCER
jgi:dienelactone hydrolase